MSEQNAIKIEGLGKKYLIGHNLDGGRPKTFREALTKGFKSALTSVRNMAQLRQLVAGDEIEEFWALKDVDLEIKRGDAVGIIGRNGAGKSTLLKVLSRITEPTAGRIEITGRVASLLEVGTGFHPELTGRENIFLNGAILGMSRKEIQRKIDRIIDFAGVEKFIDTPVKRYSSGMYVRLAFSVAAHLDPEILIVDEVLAVGDAAFQRKCHALMRELANSGKTVLFVSHNLRSLRELCRTGVLLEQGQVTGVGPIEQIIDRYQQTAADVQSVARLGAIEAWVKAEGREDGSNVFRLSLTARRRVSLSELCLIVTGKDEERLYILNQQNSFEMPYDLGPVSLQLRIDQTGPALVEGSYMVGVYLKADGKPYEDLAIARLEVPARKGFQTFYPPEVRGVVEPEFAVTVAAALEKQ
ncbi:ABC-type polysaccharide/polyol phosphate transport system ATPase subunit [Erythromicrobium ramosum]|uniref:ABC-type polysaccharide/polyol phosphate transport system ATPase subunit n=1 Tax=Erythrobacter ramosus TaxID=35811 RepID=A0A6I4US00_9SPHN|nr:ABC transporter ATP-binding protein [Erythrobacter ramosus]MBB3777212.1 ABC-type polysaccharide/polyol phosphate transport system ATPase subunit [Erythrobacter ramosus]MXP39955.1 ATP-binding cassette domain-containing protein [Erythrobacter ramosus]